MKNSEGKKRSGHEDILLSDTIEKTIL